MTFELFEAEARGLVEGACRTLAYPEVDYGFEVPPDPGLGELSCNIPFRLAKALSRTPFEIAQSIVNSLNPSGFVSVGSVYAHPTGYLNFRVNYDWLIPATLQAIFREDWATLDIGGGKRVAVEHTSVNPNKALHLGHIRNVILGDTIARILARTNHRVTVLNYVDDTGSQVADLLVGFLYAKYPLEPPEGMKFDQYCGDRVYVGVNRLYATNPDLMEAKKAVLRGLEEGVGEAFELGRKIIDRVLRDNLRTCWRVGARYDLLNWESHILKSGLWDQAFQLLKERGLLRYETEGEYAGTWCFIEKGSKPHVLVRSDGTRVYEAKDIAYAAWKLGGLRDPFNYQPYAQQPDGTTLWTTALDGEPAPHRFGNADVAITLVDVRQSDVQSLVGRAAEALLGHSKSYIHLAYEIVALSKRTAESLGIETEGRAMVQMSGREGKYVNVDPFLDRLKARAKEEAAKRNPGASEEWLDSVAEAIAIATLRYEMLKQDLGKVIVFDIEEAMRLEGDTGPYLQYTYARASSIIRKAGEFEPNLRPAPGELRDPYEERLILWLSKFRRTLGMCATRLDPHPLARYAHTLATTFNEYYERTPILKEAIPRLRATRLTLVEAFRKTFRCTLELLGIPALERI
jgi:arginyl-tRNA synthetase